MFAPYGKRGNGGFHRRWPDYFLGTKYAEDLYGLPCSWPEIGVSPSTNRFQVRFISTPRVLYVDLGYFSFASKRNNKHVV